MNKEPKPSRQELEQRALQILRSQHFYSSYFDALERSGLAGEDRSSAILLHAGISRLLERPTSVFVKGQSSSGKNFLLRQVLRLFPKDSVREITSTSATAWNYAADDFRHRIVLIQERNRASGPVHPLRLLISDDKLVRTVTVQEGGHRVAKDFVTRGPVAAMSTTTANQVEIDDETRHLSIWVDESHRQSQRILQMQVQPQPNLTPVDIATWRTIHKLIEKRSRLPIIVPNWFRNIADRVAVDDLRSRRYFPIFLAACKTQALLASFQHLRELSVLRHKRITVEFEDFAIAQILFESAFAASLHHGDDASHDIRARVARLMQANKGKPVSAMDLSRDMSISPDKAYRLLRTANASGAIQRANKPEQGNRKLYRTASQPEFIPNPDRVFSEISAVGHHARFINPLTGEWVLYSRSKQSKSA